MHRHFSMVPTGPPQHAKNGLSMPGAASPIWSSIAFFAFSFIASMAAHHSWEQAKKQRGTNPCTEAAPESEWLEPK
eukprot:CAMPEP_0179087894 /NCGR_PEP_ID=MMETSP0796-20121207/39958_1 /TAXON_ID=73915 /ORGANISM="Pyrodinium bahamense, Strain pbaha01" /LENGTH=75 /DNA_ID=CAMNT_0020785405 /DNA_START=23 /DNA_END=247 /DNA_ORIENTATION=-